MSFKREGDDFALLNNLKRRRVSELLVCHIPEDEASLLKNGRYMCTICRHKPIFDTIDMLALHRKGNKHISNLTLHLAKQQELRQLKEKKIQELYLKTGKQPSNNNKKTFRHRLLKAGPYRRKMKIDIDSNITATQPNSIEEKISISKSCSANSLVRTYIKSLSRKRNFLKVVETARLKSLGPSNDEPDLTETTKNNNQENKNNFKKEQVMDGKKSQQIEHYLKARASGWKKDRTGQWIKEEGVEFDSDEEPPADYKF